MVTCFNARLHTGFFNCRLYSVLPTIISIGLVLRLFWLWQGFDMWRSRTKEGKLSPPVGLPRRLTFSTSLGLLSAVLRVTVLRRRCRWVVLNNIYYSWDMMIATAHPVQPQTYSVYWRSQWGESSERKQLLPNSHTTWDTNALYGEAVSYGTPTKVHQ